MYYYIFDIKKCKKRSQVENIKSYLSSLGISGEYTYPSSAQSVQELVDLGLSKQYSTIVVIGSDEIANIVAGKLVGKKEAMGIIPLEASEELYSIIGAGSWQEACEILRYRKINEFRLGMTATQNSFLTRARLAINTPTDITLELKDYMVQAKAKELIINNYNPRIKKLGKDFLDIEIISVEETEHQGIISKLGSWFGQKLPKKTGYTLIRARSMRIFTKNQIPIVNGDAVIAKTPQFIESTDESLRLITAKKIT